MTARPSPSLVRHRFAALVLAGRRSADDAVARAAGVGNKCLAEVEGDPILVRVARALASSGAVRSVQVSTDDAALLRGDRAFGPLVARGEVALLNAAASAPESVIAAIREIPDPYPLLVVTGDHALLSPQMVAHFCAAAEAAGADLAVGLATEQSILSRFPRTRRTFLRFRDGAYSGCNLFALRTADALPAIAFWVETGQYRKRPLRLVRHFGVVPLILFALRLLTLRGALAIASRRLSVTVAPVLMPQPEAAIDVDKPSDLALVREIAAGRG